MTTDNTTIQNEAPGNPALTNLGIPLPSQDRDFTLSYEQIRYLQDTEKSGYTPMREQNFSLKAIFDFAENLSDQFGVDGKTDLEGLVVNFGGRFSYVDDDNLNRDDGSIFVHAEGEFDVIIPRYGYSLRNRFTIAHELGHYLIHTPRRQVFAKRLGTDQVEKEANWFAAGFLMPSRRFLVVADKHRDSVQVLSAIFGVSAQAAKYRLDVLRGAAIAAG